MIPIENVRYIVFPGGAARAVALSTAFDALIAHATLASTTNIQQRDNNNGTIHGDNYINSAEKEPISSKADSTTLDAHEWMQQLQGSGGTSIGAVLALGILFGYKKWCRIRDRMIQYDTWRSRQILQTIDLSNCDTNLSICSDESLRKMIDQVFVEDLEISTLITFKDLNKLIDGKRYVCNASCHEDHSILYMSVDTTPDLSVHQALRMSMALPCIFPAVTYCGKLYVDGGLLNNFILDQFSAEHTIGFTLIGSRRQQMTINFDATTTYDRSNTGSIATEGQWRHSFLSFIMSLIFSTIMIPDMVNFKKLKKTHATCIIPVFTPGVGPLAFPITPNMIQRLQDYGTSSVQYHVYRNLIFSIMGISVLYCTNHHYQKQTKATTTSET